MVGTDLRGTGNVEQVRRFGWRVLLSAAGRIGEMSPESSHASGISDSSTLRGLLGCTPSNVHGNDARYSDTLESDVREGSGTITQYHTSMLRRFYGRELAAQERQKFL